MLQDAHPGARPREEAIPESAAFTRAPSKLASPQLLTMVVMATVAIHLQVCPHQLAVPREGQGQHGQIDFSLEIRCFPHVQETYTCAQKTSPKTRPSYLQGQVTSFSPGLCHHCPLLTGVLTLARPPQTNPEHHPHLHPRACPTVFFSPSEQYSVDTETGWRLQT